VGGDGTATVDAISNGSYTGGSRSYTVIQTSPGYGINNNTFGGFDYGGTDALPRAGSKPWNHKMQPLGTTPQTYYYELTN
jgi:hypothetical protein